MHDCLFPPFPIPYPRLLVAISNVLSKYPASSQVFLDCYVALVACKSSLPPQATDAIMTLHSRALASFPQLMVKKNMELIDTALNVVILLWSHYPRQLPPTCNMDHLSVVVNAALDVGTHGDKSGAIQVGKDVVSCLMRLLNDEQLKEMESSGIGRNLRSLLSYYDEMSTETLQQIVVGVGMLAELKFEMEQFVDENLHSSLLFAAQKHFSHTTLQQLIWRLLSMLVQRNHSFANHLLSCGVLSAIVSIMQNEGYHLLPLVRFLTICCHQVPNPFMVYCLENKELLEQLLLVAHPDSKMGLESVTNTCDFFSFLCSKVPPSHIGQVVDLGVVLQLEDCARKWPEACMLPACIAIEGLSVPFPAEKLTEDFKQKKEKLFAANHHLFVRDMLSDPVVYVNGTLVELIYITFQKLLRVSTPDGLRRMCDKDFVEFFVIAFVRDTLAFPNQTNRIVFTAHYFVFQMQHKECFEHLKECGFHDSVVGLISSSSSYDLTVTSMGLMATLMGKYHDHFKNVKMLLDTPLPNLLVTKCKEYGYRPKSQFGDDFSRVLLNLTADKDMSLELHKRGFMSQLIDLMHSNFISVIRRSVIHAIGNIALGGQSIKQELYDKQFYEILLGTLERELERGDSFLLSACCRVLHILASGDWAKRKFVERGCIELLLRLLRTRKDNPEVSWRPLGLLSSIGFIAVSNRRYVLTPEVVQAIVRILQESRNGKVISYTVLIFLACGELDEGAIQLRELGIEHHLKMAMENTEYKTQAPDLVRWGSHVLEKQYVFTLLAPPEVMSVSTLPPPLSASVNRQVDWPHTPPQFNSHMDGQMHDRHSHKLLPLEESYFVPQHPMAPELSDSAKQQLRALGLNPDQPLFRVGRVYGSTHGFCSNCDKEGTSEELVFRPQSLTPHQYQQLIDRGWYRRGGVKMFRLRCNHNVYCCDWETRVNVLNFDHRKHKSYVRVLKRMKKAPKELTVETLPTHFSREAFDLYNDYHVHKHDKPRKSEFSYCEHIVNSPLMPQTIDGIDYGTFHQLYRFDGKLVAIGIIDVVPKGVVSIYMWYDVSKDVSKFSFGVYSALKEIELVCSYNEKNTNMRNYYLQGWNEGNKKLSYKANYSPEDFYCPCIVEDWVEELEGVKQCQQECIQQKKKQLEGEEGRGKEESVEINGSQVVQKDQTSETSSAAANSCNSHEKEKQDDTTDGPEEGADKSKDDKGAGDKPSGPAYHCEAFPNDLAHYTAQTGHSKVDVSQIVVCLNHAEYTTFSEAMQRYKVPEPQQKMMEQRYTELIVALTPELVSQLVIDLKVCGSHRERGGSSSIALQEGTI